ncbi:T3SS (YopN, CesT) and YbjN peptide-binding chaperone 1 [Nocardioides sp.]|uniref:T3SS (YopN, CesT) and YbjN peptide-binding chaperone 1 n=1 Tax=Nocardioides sp. TaxID=35761 RepID=UPI002B271C09|nr:hypothetical protein [Nocardioides sp.]
MSESTKLDVATQAAWVGFRGRLADHIAGMPHDDVLLVAPSHARDRARQERSIEVICGEEVYVETVGRPSDAPGFEALGWEDWDEAGWLQTFDQRFADQAADVVVRTLREVFGVLHPSFLDAEGLELDAQSPAEPSEPSETVAVVESPEEPVDLEGVPASPTHLRQMVEAVMTDLFPDIEPDGDGDLPVVSGGSVLFVRVLESRPCIELYAEIVLSPERLDRLAQELVLLNEAHPLWKFALRDAHVVMTHEMMALPFTALGLRALVMRFSEEVDQVARDLVARVGGHLFAESPPVEDERDVVLTGLLELLHLDRVRPSTVAGLFDDDRLEIIRQIVRIRSGRQSCGDLPEERVLTALRQALRLVSDGPQPARPMSSAPRRSVQEPLLEELPDQESLDLGWSA